MGAGWHLRPATAAALAGAIDTATFTFTRRAKQRAKPGRAAGNVALLAMWVTLAVRSAKESSRRHRYTLGLASSLLAANTALLVVHHRAGVASRRVYLAPLLASIALADAARQS